MAMKTIPTLLLTLLSIWAFTTVQSASHHGAPAPAVDCSTVILNLADCLSYVGSGSTVKKPEGSCCSGLKTVLKTNAECLCEAFKNSAQLGFSLNITKALGLPKACHVSAPSFSNCGVSIGTGAAPAPSPLAMSPAPTPGSTGLATAPASGSSGSSALAISAVACVLALVLASLSLF